jgi:hypothetical protein
MYLRSLLDSYLKIVKKNINDVVPKSIIAFLINKSKSIALNEMIK